MGSSTPVVVSTEGILVAFAPHCHHRMGCLCEVWAPKCLLARCHGNVTWFLQLAGSGTWAAQSPRYTQSWLGAPLTLMSAVPGNIKHFLVTKFWTVMYYARDIISKSYLNYSDYIKHVNSIIKYYSHTVKKAHKPAITTRLNVRALHSLVLHMAWRMFLSYH